MNPSVEAIPLAYCTNVHPSGDLLALRAALAGPVADVRRLRASGGPFRVGLWISGDVARALSSEPETAALAGLLRDQGLVVATVNAFPFGDFHAGAVKREVYRPDWTDPARLAHTLRVAAILARLPADDPCPVSTLPGSFKPWGNDPARRAAMAEGLARAALSLSRLREETGREIRLCLEPEPFGTVETTGEAIAFLEEEAHGPGLARLRREGISAGAGERVLRRHLGLCLDTCHLLAAFEDLEASFRRVESAGIAVGKVQVSACLEAPGGPEGIGRLRPFDEPRYLHQVSAKLADGTIRAWEDLAPFLRDAPSLPIDRARVHFHVPLDWKGDREGLRSPQEPIARFLGFLARRAARGEGCPVLEVETYTWGVLPSPPRSGPELAEGIARELRWAEQALEAGM